MKRSAITGIRIKDDVYQQLIDYHQENYPDTPFVVSHIILELIQKGLGHSVKQDVKQNVKQDDEYVTRQDFDTFKENITQQINELNSLLNGTLNTSINETIAGGGGEKWVIRGLSVTGDTGLYLTNTRPVSRKDSSQIKFFLSESEATNYIQNIRKKKNKTIVEYIPDLNTLEAINTKNMLQ